MKIKYYQSELYIVIVIYIISVLFFTPTFDSDYDAFANNLVNMQFSDLPIKDYYYLGFVGFNHLYKYFHFIFPYFNWSGLSQLFFSLLSIYFLLYSLRTLLTQFKINKKTIFASQVFIGFVGLETLISLTQTRYSILLCGTSLIMMVLKTHITKKEYFLYLILYFIGMLHKPESGLGMFLFSLIGTIFYVGFKPYFYLKQWIIPFFGLSLMLGAFLYDWNKTDLFERKIEPNVEYALSTGRVVDLSSMRSKDDSLKYNMAMVGMFIDTDFTNVGFLRALILTENNYNITRVVKSIKDVTNLKIYYYSYFYPLIFVILFLLIKNNTIAAIKLFIINLLYMMLFVLTACNTDISNRHLSSFLLLVVFINLIFFFKNHFYIKNDFNTIFITLTLITTVVFTLMNYKQNNKQTINNLKCFETAVKEIEKNYNNKTIVITLFNYNLFDKPFSYKQNNYIKNKYIIYDVTIYSMIPPYQKHLESICNCNPKDPVEFFHWLEKEDALYISVEKRFSIIEDYMNNYRKQSFTFYQSEMELNLKKPDCIENNNSNFEIKKVNFN
jgi:hypothetical protein